MSKEKKETIKDKLITFRTDEKRKEHYKNYFKNNSDSTLTKVVTEYLDKLTKFK